MGFIKRHSAKAIEKGNLAFVTILLEYGADPSQPSQIGSSDTPLHEIARAHFVSDFDNRANQEDYNKYKNSAAIINALLAHHKNIIDMKDIDGNTALMDAIIAGNLNAINALINHKAEISIPNNHGKDALALALAQRAGEIDLRKQGMYVREIAQRIIDTLNAYILQRRQIRKAEIAEAIPEMPADVAGLIAEHVE